MRDGGFILKYLVLLIAQVLLWNFFNFSQFLMLCFLPVMVLCIPIRHGTVYSLFFAFITGFIADFVSGGMLGLTSFALVPVALVRIPVLRLAFGQELFSRGDNISVHKLGAGKMFLGIVLVTTLFAILYIWADGAGTRPFWFNFLKVILTSAVSSILSLLVSFILCPDTNSRWT